MKIIINILLFLIVIYMIIWIMVSSVYDPGIVVYFAIVLVSYILIRRVIFRRNRHNRGGLSGVSSRQSYQDSDSADMNK